LGWTLEDVALRLTGSVTYLFQAGPVLKDGETLGISETERFRLSEDKNAGLMRMTLELGEIGND